MLGSVDGNKANKLLASACSFHFLKIDEAALQSLATNLSKYFTAPMTIYLQGALGSGKTTFVRALLKSLDYEGLVKSPTFTLVETYKLGSTNLHHFDLYRLHSAEELEFIGIRDYFDTVSLNFIEWPDLGLSYLPAPDLTLTLTANGDCRNCTLDLHSNLAKSNFANFKQ